ncbi:MAG TPA: TylF/MycF/NovP-related O-methyltransferase [Allosphingosinicella sp.]|jgi:hypothetical protein
MINLARFVRNLGSRDRIRRLFALQAIANRLIPDYRLSWYQLDWWEDPDFNAYLERFGERRGLNTHRRWMLWQLLRLTAGVKGDTAECGVFQGSSSWLICSANRGRGRTHHLFDSFEGLSKPGAEDGTYWTPGDLAAGEQIVLEKLSPFADELSFHKGWIPDRFADVEEKTFSFVHVDVDLYQPTRDSIAFFYPRLAPGAILLCDDYACSTCPGATQAADEFLADKPEKMMALDAGGGFFIKGTAVAPPGRLAA